MHFAGVRACQGAWVRCVGHAYPCLPVIVEHELK
jgi:hypothetical protein